VKSTGDNRARIVIAALGLVVALLVYAGAQRSTASPAPELAAPGAVSDRSSDARAVEAEIARTNLAARLKAALGDAFGGVWFEPATAKVHVGVTSSLSRRNAEAVAAEAGLVGSVIEDPVGSTWAELEAAQDRWDQRLADLFARQEVATSLAADRNAVEVELGSLVPAAVRAALEREAAADSVDVSVVVAPYPYHRLILQARCNAHAQLKAYCDPTIVAGVSIDDEVENEKKGDCTAGPAVIKRNRAKKEAATETFILTAGHCINKKGGVGKKWYAFNKAAERTEIGKSQAFIEAAVDVGVIKVETPNWAKANDPIPVVPTVAPWDKGAAPEPFPVTAQNDPMLGTKSCISGQTSGTHCGEVIKTDQTFEPGGGVKTENLIEVETGKITEGGDSGAPWFNEAMYFEVNGKEETPTGHVEGTHVGLKGATGNPVFQSLAISLPALKAQKNLDLELLTESNKRRHAKLKAGKYPVTIHGTSSSEKFTTEAGLIECKKSTFHAVASEGSSTLTGTPEYKECKASFLGLEATISMEGCTYVFHATAKVATDSYLAYTDVSCPAGQSIKIVAGTCKAEVKAQTELEAVDLNNDSGASPKRDITVRPTITGMAYTVTQDGAFCPFNGTGSKTDGQYTNGASVTTTGQNPSNPSEKIDVEIADE
jgi:trypsin